VTAGRVGARTAWLSSWVEQLAYRPGWRFRLGGPDTAFLCVLAVTADSLQPDRERRTGHMFRLPRDIDVMSREAFARWVFDRLLEVERHEAAEWFAVGARRPFWPRHGDGDPYEHVEDWGADVE
jgi:hypothetical protein